MAEKCRALGEVSSLHSGSDIDPLRAVPSLKTGLCIFAAVSGVLGLVLELHGFSAGLDTSGECSCAAIAELVVGISAGICTPRRVALNRCGKSSGLFRVEICHFCFALIFGRRSGLPQSPQALDQLSLFSCSMIWRDASHSGPRGSLRSSMI